MRIQKQLQLRTSKSPTSSTTRSLALTAQPTSASPSCPHTCKHLKGSSSTCMTPRAPEVSALARSQITMLGKLIAFTVSSQSYASSASLQLRSMMRCGSDFAMRWACPNHSQRLCKNGRVGRRHNRSYVSMHSNFAVGPCAELRSDGFQLSKDCDCKLVYHSN